MQNSQIKSNLRSVISLVDKLRDIKLQSYIQLPKIVTVGSQSSGKSSLIEQIVGIDFLPRGSGVVTRRPLQIRMIYQQGMKESIAQFQQLPLQKFTDFSKVKSSIQLLTDKVCGKNKNIIDNAIILTIHSSNCPNLTIIDLPGLTRISLQSQVQNIHEVTKNMIQKYMVEQNTIILSVIPANQDITNDQVLYMARKIDTKGQRTIGCITKIDIMDRGTDARMELMNKGEVPLKLGYIGIRNRSQQDINQNKTVRQALEDEKMYFSKSPIYSSLPPSCLGTTSLVDKLSKVLQSCIVNYLPTLLQKIRQKKSKLSQTIKTYGKPLPSSLEERQSLIWQLCSQFTTSYKNSISGIPCVLACHQRLQKNSQQINHILHEFLQQQSGQDFKQYLSDKKIDFALRKFDTINQLGFPSMNTFLYLVNPILNDLKLPMELKLNTLTDVVIHLADIISQELIGQYKALRQYLMNKVTDILMEYRKKANVYLVNMLECQIKGVEYQKLQFDRSRIDQTKFTQLQIKNPLIPVLRHSVINYYERCVRNLRQLIPKNFNYYVMNEAVKKIEFQIFQSCSTSPEQIQKWLQINNQAKQQRLKNQKEFQIITKAEQHILTYGGFSKAVSTRKNKKRQQRQKQLADIMIKQKQKRKQKQSRNQQKKVAEEQKRSMLKTPKKQQGKTNFFDFGTKAQYSAPKPVPNGQIPQNHSTQSPNKPTPKPQPIKPNIFAQLFGSSQPSKTPTQTKPAIQPAPQSQRKPIFNDQKDQTLKQKYNQEVGKATDKGVDQLFKNQKFQQESKKAVEKGASTAVQKQFGVSEKTGAIFGQGAAFVWGNQKTQNLVKDQTKKAARDKTQM